MTGFSRLDSDVHLARSRERSRRPPPLAGRGGIVLLVAGVVLSGRIALAQAADDGFHTIAPCRLVDTRQATAPLGGPGLEAGATRAFIAVGNCEIPDSAVAISVDAAVVAPTAPGDIRMFAGGTAIPGTSTINYGAGQTRATNAIVALGVQGAFSVFVHQPSGTTHLVVDVTGYFGTTGCAPAQRPLRPLPAINTGTRALTWDPVSGANSYDLYVRAEPGQCGLLHDVFVTRTDQKLPTVTSPYDVSAFNKCDTCYFVDVVAVGTCESPLASDLGHPAPLGFSLLPCVP